VETTLLEMMTRPADSELAARLMAREESALREAIDLYGDLVFGMARRILLEANLAEEVAQDAFLALWRRPGAFDPERGSLKTFLATLVRNKAIDLVRREEGVRRKADSLMKEMQVGPDTSRFDEEVDGRAEMDAALSRLSEVQREAITLAYFGGRTYKEVATELGIAEGTAKTRLRDGLMKLKSVLSQQRSEAQDD
jgi:RNA polymerase sigma-70 factor (ECF subfamily)